MYSPEELRAIVNKTHSLVRHNLSKLQQTTVIKRTHTQSPCKTSMYMSAAIEAPPVQNKYTELVPYTKARVEYEQREVSERVPVERTVVDYQAVKKIEYIPREKTVVDYYPVEHQINYITQTIPQKTIQYVPVERVTYRHQRIPVYRTIPHYPQQILSSSVPKLNRAQSLQNLNSRTVYFQKAGGTNTAPTAWHPNRPQSIVNLNQSASKGFSSLASTMKSSTKSGLKLNRGLDMSYSRVQESRSIADADMVRITPQKAAQSTN